MSTIQSNKDVVKTFGRISYIEPNDLAGLRGIKSANGVDITKQSGYHNYDNTFWKPEDLNMSVDLQVVVPNRKDFGYSTPDDSLYDVAIYNDNSTTMGRYVSFMYGSELNKSYDKNNTSNELTTSPMDASFMEFKKEGKSNKESLGIDSIDITFDSHFYPQVSIKFIDLRGYSLMMPTEENFRVSGAANSNEYQNFFSALFHFPYPRFLLTIKGYYGDSVTFMLAVNEFKSNFNSTTGNFEVTVTFIGYMYGLYTDIPLNFLLCAPYFGNDAKEKNGPSEVWTNSNYQYDDEWRNSMGTLIQFVDSCYSMGFTENEVREGKSGNLVVDEYRRKKEFVQNIRDLKNLIQRMMSEINNCMTNKIAVPTIKVITVEVNNEIYSITIFAPDTNDKFTIKNNGNDYTIGNQLSTVYTINKEPYTEWYEGANKTTIYDLWEEFRKKFDAFEDKYGNDDKFKAQVENIKKNLLSCNNIKNRYIATFNDKSKLTSIDNRVIYFDKLYDIDNTSTDATELDYNLINFFKEQGESNYSKINKGYYSCISFRPFIVTADKVITEIEKEINSSDNSGEVKDEIANMIMENLGFYPSIINFYRMIFAHLDCFMDILYDNVINLVDSHKADRKIGSGYITDMPDGYDGPMPIFTMFYEKDEDKGYKAVYPRKVLGKDTLETLFVEKLLSGVFSAKNTLEQYIRDAQTRENNEIISATNSSNLEGFKPISITDFFRINSDLGIGESENPWAGMNISTKLAKDGAVNGEIVLYLIWRYEQYLFSIGISNKDDNNGGEIGMREYANFKSMGYKLTKSLYLSMKDFKNKLDKEDNNLNIIRDYIEKYHKISHSKAKLFNINNDILLSCNPTYDVSLCSGIMDNLTEVIEGCNSYTKKTSYNKLSRNEIKDESIYIHGTQGMIIEDGSKDLTNKFILFKNDKIENLLSDEYLPTYATEKSENSLTSNTVVVRKGLDIEECDYLHAVYLYSPQYSGKQDVDGYPKYFNFDENIFDSLENCALFLTNIFRRHECTVRYEYIGGRTYSVHGIGYKLKESFHIPSNNEIWCEDYSTLCLCNKYALIYKYYKEKLNEKEDSVLGKAIYELLIKDKFEKTCEKLRTHIKGLQDARYISESTSLGADEKFKDIFGWTIQQGDNGWYNFSLYIIFNNKTNGLYEFLMNEIIPYPNCILYNISQFSQLSYNDTNIKNIISEFYEKLINDKDYNTLNDVKTDEEQEEEHEIINADITDDMRLATYMSLKNLCDKWLPSYNKKGFELRDVADYRRMRKERLSSGGDGAMNNYDIREMDNFMFIDSFYNDISYKYIVDIKTVCDIIVGQLSKNNNYSVYEFMADICQQNKLLFIALPVYNNLYNADGLANIFSPQYDSTMKRGLGTTYICMYTYEVSHVLNEGKDSGIAQDGLDIADINGDIAPDAKLLFEKNEEDGFGANYTIPAFGVTYARQNQQYFDRITVNMDNPRATDYSIANLFQLADMKNDQSLHEPRMVTQNIYSIYANRSYNCSVEMLGCANIMPMMYFQLNNIPMFRGAYMITKVRHNIRAGQFKTIFEGVRISKRQLPFDTEFFNLISNVTGYGGKNHKEINAEVNAALKTDGTGYGTFDEVQAVKRSEYTMWLDNGKKIVTPSQHTSSGGNGRCTEAVATYLNAGFHFTEPKKITLGADATAVYNSNVLEDKFNFKEIGFIPGDLNLGRESANKWLVSTLGVKKGDIAVMLHSDHGHICMYRGNSSGDKAWLSDFTQLNGFWPYAAEKVKDTKIYRFKGDGKAYKCTSGLGKEEY